MQLLQDAESQPVANVPAVADEGSVLIRTLTHTLYALLATLTTRRSLRLVQRVPNRNGFEVWRQLAAENAPRVEDSQMLQAVLQPGMCDSPAKFEETCFAWEHQDWTSTEKLATSKLDDDVKVSDTLTPKRRHLDHTHMTHW